MKVPLKLNGMNYKSHLLEQEEIVRDFSGKYLMIDISKANSEEVICFKSGRYVINDFNTYGRALAEFGNEIVSKLYGANSVKDYELFIKGTADILGDTTFSSECQAGCKPSEVCCFSHYRNSDYIFVSDTKCQTIKFPIYNRDLPNLRAYFLKEKFDAYYSANYKSPILLDGNVVDYISEFERNASIILFLSNNFLKN